MYFIISFVLKLIYNIVIIVDMENCSFLISVIFFSLFEKSKINSAAEEGLVLIHYASYFPPNSGGIGCGGKLRHALS